MDVLPSRFGPSATILTVTGIPHKTPSKVLKTGHRKTTLVVLKTGHRKTAPKNTIEEDQLRNTCGDAAKESSRNPLVDTLAQVCGMDICCMATGEWRKVEIALAVVNRAQPDVRVAAFQSHAVISRKLSKMPS